MKPVISKLIAFLCYWTGLDALFYYINRRAKEDYYVPQCDSGVILASGEKCWLDG